MARPRKTPELKWLGGNEQTFVARFDGQRKRYGPDREEAVRRFEDDLAVWLAGGMPSSSGSTCWRCADHEGQEKVSLVREEPGPAQGRLQGADNLDGDAGAVALYELLEQFPKCGRNHDVQADTATAWTTLDMIHLGR